MGEQYLWHEAGHHYFPYLTLNAMGIQRLEASFPASVSRNQSFLDEVLISFGGPWHVGMIRHGMLLLIPGTCQWTE